MAAVYAVAMAMSACSEKSPASSTDAGTGGSPGTGGSGGGAAGSGAAPDAQAECATSDECTGGKRCVDGKCVDATGCQQDDECKPEMECIDGACKDRVVCPTSLEATFDSIHTKVFAVSCGTDTNSCHSRRGSTTSGGLNLADDPYTALLGADGKGAPAANIAGSEKGLRRVVPSDPDASFLVIKLSTRTSQDPKYGSGMPFGTPGSVCPDALTTIRKWIEDGAKQ